MDAPTYPADAAARLAAHDVARATCAHKIAESNMKAPEPPRFPSIWEWYYMTPEQRVAASARYHDDMRKYGYQCLNFLAELYGLRS